MNKAFVQLLLFISMCIPFIGKGYADANGEQTKSLVNDFTLTAINFNKTGLINSFEFFKFYENYLGARVQISTLKKICNDITNHYQINGYGSAHCTLPFQKIQYGVVNMYIIEGVVSAVKLIGDVDADDGLLNSYLDKITLYQPLDETELLLVEKMFNAVPGLSVRTYTRALPDTQDIELVFDIKQKSFSTELYANNRGSRVIGPAQAGLSLASYSLLNMHEYMRLHLLTTEEIEELKLAELSSAWPIGDEGSNIIVEALYVNSKPGDFLAPLKINVDITAASLGWSKPLLLTVSETLLLTGSVDYYKSDTDFSNTRVAQDELYKVRLSFDYITNNNIHYTNTNVTLKMGLRDLNTTEVANDTGDDFVSTGREDYSAIKFDVFYRVILRRNLFLSNQLQGQYAFRELPVSEDIFFGGEIIGNAYDQAELFGDHGLGGKIRLTYQLSDSWISSGYTQFYSQYDIARVWNDTLGIISSMASLSAGATIGSGRYYLDLQVAQPLTKNVLLEGNDDMRYFVNARLFY